MESPIDIYAEKSVLDRLQHMFSYIFEPHKNVNQSFVASLIAHRLTPGEAVDLFGARWTPIRLLHGRLPILGFRVDFAASAPPEARATLAYCTDVSGIPPESYP